MRTLMLMVLVPIALMVFILSYPLAIVYYTIANGRWLNQATYCDLVIRLFKLPKIGNEL